MKTLHASACAKCILIGEHSILYGSKAISLPIKNLRLNIQFEKGDDCLLTLEGAEGYPNSEKLFWDILKKDFSDIDYKGKYLVQSKIPLGAGLGSSAALAVALHQLHRPNLEPHSLIERSWKSEGFFHGKSSGMDPCTIALEQSLYFENIQHYEVLDDSFTTNPNYVFVLVDSQIRRSAQKSISSAHEFKDSNPDLWNNIIQNLSNIVEEAKVAFEKCQASVLGPLMNKAHELLREWGLSHPELEKIRHFLLSQGALGVKLTGAGKGGFLISIFERNSWLRIKSGEHARGLKFFELSG